MTSCVAEWSFAYDLKFGLYEWDRDDPAGKRTLREGAKVMHLGVYFQYCHFGVGLTHLAFSGKSSCLTRNADCKADNTP